MWIHPCAQVIFDDNPAPKDKTSLEAIEEMSQAMIRYELIIRNWKWINNVLIM